MITIFLSIITSTRLFDWRPDKLRGERNKHERTVIIKNLFTVEMFDKEVHLILEYQGRLREEGEKCGTVRKVVVYDVSWMIFVVKFMEIFDDIFSLIFLATS